MERADALLLDVVQFEFPLTVRPFARMAERLRIGEAEVLARIAALKASGVIRQISPIFDSATIGYHSTLAAFRVAPAKAEKVAALLNAHEGVSHNYLRQGSYNLWFTLTLPASADLEKEIGRLAKKAGVNQWMYLPSVRTFKVNFRLDLSGTRGAEAPVTPTRRRRRARVAVDPAFVREVQRDLPLVSRPYADAAKALGRSEAAIVRTLGRYVKAGLVRRVAAVLRQKKAGYGANVMVAWAPKTGEVERLGEYAASRKLVSHCYERPPRAGWPFSVYTMVHGKTEREVKAVIADIVKHTGVTAYQALKTVKEFKKVRVTYYKHPV